MLNRLFIAVNAEQTIYRTKMFHREYRSRMFRTNHRTKNVLEKKNLLEKTMFRTDRQTDYLSQEKQKGSAMTIYRSKTFRTTYRTKKRFGQAVYRNSKYCEWKVTHKTRTDLFPVRPAIGCPQDNKQKTAHVPLSLAPF